MRFYLSMKVVVNVCIALCSIHVVAQEAAVASDSKETTTPIVAKKLGSIETKTSKPMVKDATISLQTTITGNQEQPKVLYILPWQSPLATDVDFEPLDSLQKAVFSHVERDELRRELEATDAIKD